MRQSHTGVLERNTTLTGEFATEPMETAWATEARWFVQVLDTGTDAELEVITQVSPDGLTWCDLEGDTVHHTAGQELTSWAITGFGGWLRLRGRADEGGVKVRIYLALKE
ncbi:MAG TPA: hypothetical protein IAA98_10555 [Candidatus Avipropionibacterium avicola]|uniref:Uncharacterized protein n=1 Tax=Candidatus Avipropionibacterium avicola TaxID=2840701 RepID=A0A9D1GY74_9ACTN|nr:hypothetical protein [Candidatus Avipropionibacterium avicola]